MCLRLPNFTSRVAVQARKKTQFNVAVKKLGDSTEYQNMTAGKEARFGDLPANSKKVVCVKNLSKQKQSFEILSWIK